MKVTISADWSSRDPAATSAVGLVAALEAAGALVAVDTPRVGGGLPTALLEALARTSHDSQAVLHVGDAADSPPDSGGRLRVVWHHPSNLPVGVHPGWDGVIVTHPEVPLPHVAVVAMGADLDGFGFVRRTPPLTRVLIVGADLELAADIANDYEARHNGRVVEVSAIDPATASRTLRRQLFPQADVAVLLSANVWEAAAELAATGAYLIGPDDADLSGLLRADWATPHHPGAALDEVADLIADALGDKATPHRASLGANYVGTAYDWERVGLLLLQHLRRLL